jgi:hypothetical protein
LHLDPGSYLCHLIIGFYEPSSKVLYSSVVHMQYLRLNVARKQGYASVSRHWLHLDYTAPMSAPSSSTCHL